LLLSLCRVLRSMTQFSSGTKVGSQVGFYVQNGSR
jgi:hypothetical protein